MSREPADFRPDVVWLRGRGCPSWCASGDHTQAPAAEDRAHWSEFHEIELTLHDQVPMVDGSTSPDRVIAVLEQEEHEQAPKVRQITAQGHDQLVMTLDEAERLGRILMDLVEESRTPVPSQRS